MQAVMPKVDGAARAGGGAVPAQNMQHVVWGRVEPFAQGGNQQNVEFLAQSSESGNGGSHGVSSSGDTSRSSVLKPSEHSARSSGRPSPSSGPKSSGDGSPEVQEASTAGVRSEAQAALTAAGLWSKGSSKHFSSRCVACHWVHSAGGCKRGPSCEFCHIPHTHPDIGKLGENRRTYCEQYAAALAAALRKQQLASGGFVAVANAVSDRSTYLRSLLLSGVEGEASTEPTSTMKAQGGKRLLSL